MGHHGDLDNQVRSFSRTSRDAFYHISRPELIQLLLLILLPSAISVQVLVPMKMLIPPNGKVSRHKFVFTERALMPGFAKVYVDNTCCSGDMTPRVAKQPWSQVELRVRRAGTIARSGLPFGLAFVAINQHDSETAVYE